MISLNLRNLKFWCRVLLLFEGTYVRERGGGRRGNSREREVTDDNEEEGDEEVDCGRRREAKTDE